MSNHRTKSEKSTIEILLAGLLLATVSFFAFMLASALVAYLGDDPTYKSELWSFGAMLISGAVTGFINARRQNSMITALLSSLALVLILFIIGSISYGVPSLPTIVNYAIYIGISGISAFFGARKPVRRHR